MHIAGGRWKFNTVAGLLVCLVAGLAGGCAAVGVIAHKLIGPPPVQAKYTLEKVATVIMVEAYQNPSGSFAVSELLAGAIADDLKENDPKLELVSTDKLIELRDADVNAYAKMRVSDILAAVEARQAIYVDVQQSVVEPVSGGEYIRGRLLVRVKVIDDTGKLLWPESSDGFPVMTETPTSATGKGSNAITMQDGMAQSVGLSIGRLFHKWKTDE